MEPFFILYWLNEQKLWGMSFLGKQETNKVAKRHDPKAKKSAKRDCDPKPNTTKICYSK